MAKRRCPARVQNSDVHMYVVNSEGVPKLCARYWGLLHGHRAKRFEIKPVTTHALDVCSILRVSDGVI